MLSSSAINSAIPRNNLGESVYRLLWERILDRRLRPGEKLSDLHLSDELGVSRTPVREALHRLVSDGIVRVEPNRGFFVESFSARDIGEIYDLRATLEVMALEIAASRFTPAMLQDALNDLAKVEQSFRDASTEAQRIAAARAFLEVDRGFHRRIVDLAGNSRLQSILEGLWAQIAVFQNAGSFRDPWTDLAITHHRAVIGHLLTCEIDRAMQRLKEHILEVKELVLDDLTFDDPVVSEPASDAPSRRRSRRVSEM